MTTYQYDAEYLERDDLDRTTLYDCVLSGQHRECRWEDGICVWIVFVARTSIRAFPVCVSVSVSSNLRFGIDLKRAAHCKQCLRGRLQCRVSVHGEHRRGHFVGKCTPTSLGVLVTGGHNDWFTSICDALNFSGSVVFSFDGYVAESSGHFVNLYLGERGFLTFSRCGWMFLTSTHTMAQSLEDMLHVDL